MFSVTTDPLADLLAEMVASRDHISWDLELCQVDAEWLRANRDRMLEALGGEQDVYDLEVLGPTILWAFPEEPR